MNVGPFDIAEVIARLEGLGTGEGGFRSIGGAADFEAARKSTIAAPAAFVTLADEVGQKRQGGSTIAIQAVDVRIAVLYVVRDYRGSEGGSAKATAMAKKVEAARGRLIGWTPGQFDPAWPLDLVSASLIDYSNATLWWQDIYSTRYWRRGT